MQLACPICQAPLTRDTNRWHCPAQHSFDIARQGYANLLPAQHKRSRNPGDDRQMVAARTRLLERGYYRPLLEQLIECVTPLLRPGAALLDAGCGEGYYTAALAGHLPANSELVGIDISREAIRAACRRSREITWLVASSARPPVVEHSCDGLLCLFAPLQADAFARCLKTDGWLLVATTGPDHLLQLRQRLYPELRQKRFDPAQQLANQFERYQQSQLRTDITLADGEAIRDLLTMTPHLWRSSPQRQQALADLTQLTVTLDVQFQLFRPNTP